MLQFDWRTARAEIAVPLVGSLPDAVKVLLAEVDVSLKQDKNCQMVWPDDGGAFKLRIAALDDVTLATAAIAYYSIHAWREVHDHYMAEWRLANYIDQVLQGRLVAAHLLASQPHGTYAECFHPDRDPLWWNLIANRPEAVGGWIEQEAALAFIIKAADLYVAELAQAIEARRAETRSGSVHESAVPEGNVPEGQSS